MTNEKIWRLQPGAGTDAYFNRVREAQEQVFEEERPRLLEAAMLLADSLNAGSEPDRIIHVFGAGHSHLLAEEAFWRAGGLVPINPILDPNLTPLGGRRASPLERLEGYANVLLSAEDLRSGEVMVIVSNSGINPLPIEMALVAKESGLKVLAITSLSHSERVDSRHSTGRKLYELADVVIDTHVPPGDAAVSLPGLSEDPNELRIAPLSTVMGAMIWNALVAEVAYLQAAAGSEPLVFRSQNMPGGDEANERQLRRYRLRNRLY